MDKRTAPRSRTLRTARIMLTSDGGIDCVLRNVSKTGAQLEVTSPVGIPDRFDLMMPDRTRRACHVVWRKATRIGITFD